MSNQLRRRVARLRIAPHELAFGDVDRLIEALIQVVRRELGLEPATILSRLARVFLDEFCIASSDL